MIVRHQIYVGGLRELFRETKPAIVKAEVLQIKRLKPEKDK
jgi:hypothetical protein